MKTRTKGNDFYVAENGEKKRDMRQRDSVN